MTTVEEFARRSMVGKATGQATAAGLASRYRPRNLTAIAAGRTSVLVQMQRLKSLLVAADGAALVQGATTAYRALEGWASGWALADNITKATATAIVLAYGKPVVSTEIERRSIPMCDLHVADSDRQGLLIGTEPPLVPPPGGPCWVCNPQYMEWEWGTA